MQTDVRESESSMHSDRSSGRMNGTSAGEKQAQYFRWSDDGYQIRCHHSSKGK